ncbi:siphovirus Gp157 family protein [Brotaphodocola sp.]|uniref:siphovirus Gp157 family protein n=1 Tax=Brotaphodocola sp. TaxID=3073577 RepID=UPI003D7E1AB7
MRWQYDLYEIDQAITDAWLSAVDPETGEIIDEEAKTALDALEMEKGQKVENILLWAKDLRAKSGAIKAEAKNMTARANEKDALADKLEEYAARALAGEKFETTRVKVTWRKSQVVEYTGLVEDLPKECIRQKLPEVDKAELKKLLKAGAEIPGAKLVTRNNMQIK